MSKRRALLIGVPEYESDAIPNLPIVCQDLKLLHAALEKSGFSVRSLGEDGQSYGRNQILQALRRECKDVKNVDTLVLYFSGHGLHFQGKDYLVPFDAALDDPEAIADYLVPVDLSREIDQAQAKTIIFIVDACREGIKLDVKDIALARWSRGERKQATHRGFVLVFSCGPGQKSRYVSGEQGFSLFSRALAEVLAPQHAACTLQEVLAETQVRLNAIAAEHNKQPQKIHYSFESAVEDDIASRVICDSVVSVTAQGQMTNPWLDAVSQSSLWPQDMGDERCPVVRMKQHVTKVVSACWQQWQASIQALPEDAWRDENLPIRALELLGMVVPPSGSDSDGPTGLSLAETALIITVPFVREAVLASGMVQSRRLEPLSLERSELTHVSNDKLYGALDKQHKTQPRFMRKAQRLQDQNRIVDKNAVMAWLLHRCLFKTLDIWEPESEGGYLADELVRVLDSTARHRWRLVKETLTRQRVLELAYCMYADSERIDRSDRPNALQNYTVGTYGKEQNIREQLLAYLLKLAGLLAIDIPNLSDVLVDHIGLADPLTPKQILETVKQARWTPSGRGRTLTVTCHHPAIDKTLTEYVEDVDRRVLSHMLRHVADKRGGMEVLTHLPAYLQADGIKAAAKSDGAPVYQVPHINFQLAHDEVRELLMGEQLYGDPMLAIRELYQNALDACRYRQARLQYLKQKGDLPPDQEDWEGKIIFHQSKDEHGRAYIECEDNGIGMGMTHLEKCFARAGKRFADLPEFIEEQAEWLKCDPPIKLYPNSQFGVGVLSYFMLADEIEVDTCRLNREGLPSQRLQIRIPGGSGLFRIQEFGTARNAGTRIRLYLSRTHHKGRIISCIETLRKLLWIAEFKTEVYQFGRQEFWEPEELRHPNYPPNYCLNVDHPDIWWVPESEYWHVVHGCVLSDGLWTRELQPGFIFNLRREHLPKLTVDRQEVVEWDKGWVVQNLIKNAERLIDWSYTDFNLLWKLEGKHPKVAVHIVEQLTSQQSLVRLGRGNSGNLEVAIHQTGCFQYDGWLNYYKYSVNTQSLVSFLAWWILPHRVLLWGKQGLVKIPHSFLASITKCTRINQCPVLEAGDSIALNKDLPPTRYQKISLQDFVPPSHIVHVSATLKEPISQTVKRFQRFQTLGLKIPKVDHQSLRDVEIFEEDLIALSREIREVRGFGRKQEQWKFPWIENEISAAQIVLAATRLNEPIATTIQRLQKFIPVGLGVVSPDPELLKDIEITPEDIIALSISLDGEEALARNLISPAQILFASNKLNEPISDTINRFSKFVPIGLKLPNIDLSFSDHVSVTPDDLIILSEDLDEIIEGKIAWSDHRLPVAKLVRSAQKLNEPIRETFKRFQKFTFSWVSLAQKPRRKYS